jgi:hypothetical protein
MRGGQTNLNEIESNLKNIQQQVNEALDVIKVNETSSTSDYNEPAVSPSTSTTSFTSDYDNEPAVSPSTSTTSSISDYDNEPSVITSIPKPWQDDKNTKFNDCCGGRVTLSFPRIMTLLQGNINKGNKTKNWSSIKSQLTDATSISEVNSIIKQSGLNFSSNSILGGTKKRRRGGRKRRTRRY